MCGIAGFIQRRPPDLQIIARMLNSLRHRGPDGEGIWTGSRNGWHITLGHRRLAIIDLAHGAQPLANETGEVRVTYNGEIYNHAALRARLETAGHHFATHCDTEVIVHQHEQHGPLGVSDFDGMFAFGVWDDRDGSLLLARDRVGIKPLYYASLPDGGIAFASELIALLQHPDLPLDLDPQALAGYFFRDYIHPPRTIVQAARKLEPGHTLVWRDGALGEPARFWDPPAIDPHTPNNLIERLRTELDRAVASQLMSDVPLGVFLSGGIDSSLVAAIAQQHARGRLQTFTIAFDDPAFDESRFARRVAHHIRSQHVEETFSEERLLELFDCALGSLDEPMADPSILPTYALSRLASRHVKVALGGDGGDELWAGYPTYKAHRLARIYQRLPGLMRRHLIEPVVAALPVGEGYQTLEWKAKRFALRWDDEPGARHLRWMSSLDLPDLSTAMSNGLDRAALLDRATQNGHHDALADILLLDFTSYLPGSVLTKVDRASMAHSLEVRPPLLANSLVDLAFSLPSTVKMNGAQTKSLLKRAASKWLPDEIIHRRKKGFAIPLAKWLRGPLRSRVEDMLASSPLWNLGFLRRDAFAQWNQEHQTRRRDHARPLYAALVLDHWFRRTEPAVLRTRR